MQSSHTLPTIPVNGKLSSSTIKSFISLSSDNLCTILQMKASSPSTGSSIGYGDTGQKSGSKPIGWCIRFTKSFAVGLLNDFIKEKLDGNIDNLRTYDLSKLRDDSKYGDCSIERAPIVRAIMALAFADTWPNLSVLPLRYLFLNELMNKRPQPSPLPQMPLA